MKRDKRASANDGVGAPGKRRKQHTPNLWSQSKPERRFERPFSEDAATASGKRKKVEGEVSKSGFEWKWEQTPDPHADEELWVTGRDEPFSCMSMRCN